MENKVKFKKKRAEKNIYGIFVDGHEIGAIQLNRKEFDYVYFYGNEKNDMSQNCIGLTIGEVEEVSKNLRKFVKKESLRKFGGKK